LFHPAFEIRSSVWVIMSSINTSNIIFGDNIIPGKNRIYYSHRSELGGIIGGLYYIITLCNKYQINKVKTIVSCDGQETIDKANQDYLKPTMFISHFDLISTLYHIIHLMPGEVCFSHIKGYQDKRVNSVSIMKELNVIADIRVKVVLYEFIVSVGNISKLQSNREIISGIKVNVKFLSSNIVLNFKKRNYPEC